MAFLQTRAWTGEEFIADAQAARTIFRNQRLGETLDDYKDHFATAVTAIEPLLARLRDIVAGTISYDDLSALLKGKSPFTAFRYLAGPPISDDDLATVSGAKKSTALWTKPNDVELVRATMAQALDPVRFPWVAEGRDPTDREVQTAILATGVLIAQSRVGTGRRNLAKTDQEMAVQALLDAEGFQKVERRTITLAADAPPPGSYCPESTLGGTRGDIIVTLPDRLFMAIECKASNSEVNSFKRLNHEAVGKAVKWRNAFGHSVVPAAVLSGVFSVANLASAQDGGGLAIYWQHRLADLADFVRQAT